jgi:AcrR family transcriptional regulator
MTRSRKGRQAEAVLVEAARRVLERKGYFNTTIADITAEAGKSNGSFHHYFANKDELLLSLISDHATRLCARISPEEHAAGIHTWVGMRAHVREFWRMFEEQRAESVAIFQAAMASEDFARRLRDENANNIEQLAAHLREAQARGYLSQMDPRLAAAAVAGMLHHVCLMWSIPGLRPSGIPDDPERIIDTLTALALGGIGSRDPADPAHEHAVRGRGVITGES